MKKSPLPHRKQIFIYCSAACLLVLLALPGLVFAVATAVIKPVGNGIYTIDLQYCDGLSEVHLTVVFPLSMGTPQISPKTIAISNKLNVTSGPSMVDLDIIAKNGILPLGGTLLSLMFPDQQGDPVPVNMSGWAKDQDGNSKPLNAWYQGPNDKPKDPEPDNTNDEQNNGSDSAAVTATPAPQAAAGATKGQNNGSDSAAATATPDPQAAAGAQSGSAGGDGLKPAVVTAGNESTIPVYGDPRSLPVTAQTTDNRQVLLNDNKALNGSPQPVPGFRSVLDRFRTFAGVRNEAGLLHLFDPDPASPFRQNPAAAITDGRSKVTVSFNLDYLGQDVKAVVLNNVHLIAFRYSKDGSTAEMIVLPEAGMYKSSLMIKAGERLYDVPLTVAPPLDPDMVALGVSNGEIVRHDYNNDGVVDYLDDYILMVNRLALVQKSTYRPGPSGESISGRSGAAGK